MSWELVVGVATWNSELFLPQCLQAILRTTETLEVRLGVVDNVSTDCSVEIARAPLRLPWPQEPEREPKVTRRHDPDLATPFAQRS